MPKDIKKLSKRLQRKVFFGSHEISTNTSRNETFFLNVFSFLTIIVMFSFGYLDVASNKFTIFGVLEMVVGLTLVLNILGLRLTHNITIAKRLLLASVLTMLTVILITGGGEYGGINWLFIFPPISFLLAGKKEGVFWLFGLLIAVMGVIILSVAFPFSSYSQAALNGSFLASLFAVSLCTFTYQLSVEKNESEIYANLEQSDRERRESSVILNNLNIGVVVVDNRGNITALNSSAENILRWRSDELIGKQFIRTIPLFNEFGDPISAENHPLYIKPKGILVANDLRIMRKDGTTFLCQLIGTPLMVSGKHRGTVSTIRDITKEHDAERAKTEFVTLASHQLRTPISAIKWLSEMLMNGDFGKLTSVQSKQINNILSSNERMSTLVNEMLIVANIDLGTLPIQPVLIDVGEVAEEVAEIEMNTIEPNKKINLKIKADKKLPKVYLDLTATKTILHHLIKNALKYTPANGHVSVEVIHTPASKDKHTEEMISIIVSDSGYGIPKSEQNKVFTKFFRSDNIKAFDTDGSGLGLYVVRSLLDYIGGRITFDSTENVGTTFVVKLPVAGMKTHSGHGVQTSSDIVNYLAETAQR